MGEYTPTTEQVESAYAYDPEYEYRHPDNPGYHLENRRAFRRWLAAEKARAWREGYDEGVQRGIGHVLDIETAMWHEPGSIPQNPYAKGSDDD